MNHATPDLPCACPGCSCQVTAAARYERDGKAFCSQACADLHPRGQACPSAECHCESHVKVQDRAVSDSQLDEAIEETFPASDPISP
ncbi:MULTISPECIES: metallothionein [unclassified Pseudomonas]|uniref:metallothionein n=1 Tax=unclassified Pseudomonas TaxID=196821 RepID=UPI000F6CB932|nr:MULTISPECIES: metallothionein [unclassified Pseudomonas]AZF37512.1 Metallothionein [Pseudomonas sp. R4-39-08]AZF42671.1 Metallothionein [Pseudomonas sp. R1-43-08]AZF58396.1 Metallothionein [Pseudomonas sp. R11-23-07]